MAREWREPFCPVCGRGVGKRNVKTPAGITIGQKNYWQGLQPYDTFPFGLVKKSEGKGSLEIVREYSIDEDREGYYEIIKARMLNAVKVWLSRGWIKKEDIESILD